MIADIDGKCCVKCPLCRSESTFLYNGINTLNSEHFVDSLKGILCKVFLRSNEGNSIITYYITGASDMLEFMTAYDHIKLNIAGRENDTMSEASLTFICVIDDAITSKEDVYIIKCKCSDPHCLGLSPMTNSIYKTYKKKDIDFNDIATSAEFVTCMKSYRPSR
jgi:hypothetical protein